MSKLTLEHDGQFDLAVGRHRRETNWKNKETTWSDLVTKLSTTHRTAETFKEYLAHKKSRQDEIKDVGGFVGGYLTGGKRKNDKLVYRQLITLDADYASPELWDDFTLVYHNAAVIYSTHKHSADAPRYRLIMPINRPVNPEEFQAISRRVAGLVGIDYFDPGTSYKGVQPMYWPSTSKDGEYVFKYQDGPWIDADAVLASYHDWTDSSEWPSGSREDKFVQYGIKKQGDPLEKPGIVGAFCRTYGIQEVIEEILGDVYEPCDVEGRYTYKEGSTSGGLVTYEDKFAYSHHGTDIISGKLCNAFDLVRIHKYHIKDEDVREDTPTNRRPSYLAMMDFCTRDPKVRKQLGTERIEGAKFDFNTDDEPLPDTDLDDPVNDDWLGEMDVDRKGNNRSTIDNVMLIFKNDPSIKDRLGFNLFEQREVALKNLPWRKVTPETRYLTDKDDAGVRHYMEKKYGIAGVQKTTDALALALMLNSFHPVRDYLSAAVWDGESRIETLLIDYFGAADNPYVRAVTRKSIVAGVARIFRPGIKFDNMLVLVGEGGKGKSTFVKRLGRDWFSDSFVTVEGKEAFEQLQGVWVVEMAELAGLRNAELDAIKHFMSKSEDRYRVAYGRRTENFPRQCFFIGTCNPKGFLKKKDRRFWPVDILETDPVYNIFEAFTPEVVDQVWAEAVELYKRGEELFLSPEIEILAAENQSEHAEFDERFGTIQNYLDTLLPHNWSDMGIWQRRDYIRGDELYERGTMVRNRVCIAEIWCEVFGGTHRDMTKHNTKDLHDIMRIMPGWREDKKTDFKGYGTQFAYRRIDVDNISLTNVKARADFEQN